MSVSSDVSLSSDISECAICLEEKEGFIATLSCGHEYHYKCVQNWIKKKNNPNRCCCICDFDTEIINLKGEDENTEIRIYQPELSWICCAIL